MENEEMIQMNLRLPKALRQELMIVAARTDQKASVLIRNAVAKEVAELNKQLKSEK